MPQEPNTTDSIIASDSKIADYQLLVNTKAECDSQELLPNAGAIHAAIAMSKLFDKTKDTVRMVVGSFSGTVCDQPNYLTSLLNCINRRVHFRIIHIENLNVGARAYQYLLAEKAAGADISFHQASNEFKEKLTLENAIRHFAVFDDDKFRYETDTKNYVAWFTFNDTKNASILLRTFDKEFK